MEFDEFDRLECYLNNELSDAQKYLLEDELKNDPELQKKLDQLKITGGATEAYGLKIKLDQIHDELYTDNNKPKIGIRKLYYYVAAACISLLALGWWLYSPTQSSAELYTQYFEVYPDFVTSRAIEESGLSKAIQYYNDEKYQLAANEFQVLYLGDSLKYDVSFYLGLSYLNTGSNTKAIKILNSVVENSDKYQQQARWYLALAFLKNNQLDKAKTTLLKIKPLEYHYSESREIIENLH